MTQPKEKLYYSISEVADAAEVKPHVLRYWETQFKMLKPRKNRAGNRMYRPRDLQLVLTIRDLLYHNGYTIAGARRNLLDAKKDGRLVDGKLVSSDAPPSAPARPSAARARREVALADGSVEHVGEGGGVDADPSQLSITDVARVKAVQGVRRELESLLGLLDAR